MGAITQIEANATAKDNFPQLVLLLTPLLSQPPMMARRTRRIGDRLASNCLLKPLKRLIS